MREFFEAIESLDPNGEAAAAVVVSGEHAGEKIVLAGGKILFAAPETGFLPEHREELFRLRETGLSKIGGVPVYAEMISRAKKMVICGAGHVALPVIRLAKEIGMQVTVLDDRADFVGKAIEAGADEGVTGAFADTLPGIPGDSDTFFVILTRGHQFDKACLREILKKPNAYIGMMGSRRRAAMAKQNMIDEGFDPAAVDAVHTPIGLDIGSETPEEIAVSILAEVIQVKNARKTVSFPADIMAAILTDAHTADPRRRMVLSTIIARKGSAPREVGTKMLIYPDGTTVNTIGGGLFEHNTIEHAVKMLAEPDSGPEVFHVDLTADDAAKEGEVCGGSLSVYLEEV